MRKRIGIIGAGNMGSILAVKFSRSNDVVLYTNMTQDLPLYKKDMQVYLEDNDSYYSGNIKEITSDLKLLVDSSDYIFITFPSFLFGMLSKELIPLLHEGQHLVFIPGSGAAELYFKDALKKGVTITGLQRVHSVARIIKMGELTKETGVRGSLRVASIPAAYNSVIAPIISKLYGLPVEQLDNYLNITLINSNPILHTSRLYSIFKDYPDKVKEYDSLPLFYENWDMDSAITLVKMDKELFKIFDKLEQNGLPVKQIKPILEHYESKDEEGLKNKISSIKSFKGLTTPSVKLDNGKYIPDFNSRYFTADFPYGLEILLSIARLLNTEHPTMDEVDGWYRRVSHNPDKGFNLKDIGINSEKEFLEIYK